MRMGSAVLGMASVALLACTRPSNTVPTAPTATEPATAIAAPKANSEFETSSFPRYEARAFFETISVLGASFSHDEKRILITSDASGVFNVYSQPVEGGPPTALTRSSTDNAWAVSFFPADDRFLYVADQGGNEITHLFVASPNGQVIDLTPGERVKARFMSWSADKRSFFVETNERDPRFFDVYRYETETYERELVFRNDAGWEIGDIDPHGRRLAAGQIKDNRESDIYLVDLRHRRAKPRLVTPHEKPAKHETLTFSSDGAVLYYSTNAHSEFGQAWGYHIDDKKHAPAVQSAWDVMFMDFSKSGRYRVVATNEDARTVVEVLDTVNNRPVAIPSLPAGEITDVEFSPSENQMAFYVSSDRSPRDLYVLDLRNGEHRRLTTSQNPAIDPKQLVDGEVIRYPSFDGLEIPAILYRPREASEDRRVPALLWVHGGPGGQSRRGYRAEIQHFVNQGYAILAVNNRGSSGYGKTFHHLDDRKHGEVDLDDCVWARKYLEGLDWVDGDHIGIMGGSYGGYMVLAALAFRPEAFEVGVDIFGVSNWIRTLESIPPWWASFRESLYTEIGDPKRDRARLESRSPLRHANKIVRPLLVIQGANDPRVLKVESDEIVAAVKSNGVPVEYVVFDDEGHGFRKRVNRIKAAETTVEFLEKHLRPDGTSG